MLLRHIKCGSVKDLILIRLLRSNTVSKASILNEQFHSVYTCSVPDLRPGPFSTMVNITIHERGILKLQKGLCPFKDTGHDETLAFILNKVQRFNSPISDKDVPALPR